MKRGHIPIRMCRGCGRRRPKQALVRFVIRDGRLVASAAGSGRGLYCCPSDQCMVRLRKGRGKNKLFR